MLTDLEAMSLGRSLEMIVSERGFGSLSKKDYELLVFHHISEAAQQSGDWNYVLANKLKVTETRVKSLRLESSIRHRPANHKAIIGKIVQRILEHMNQPDFSGEIVTISLEDPVDRREFEYAVKLINGSVEYGINREILKIQPMALFEILLGNAESAETRFKEVVQSCIKAKARQHELLDNSLTLRQRINKLGAYVSTNDAAIALISGAYAIFLR